MITLPDEECDVCGKKHCTVARLDRKFRCSKCCLEYYRPMVKMLKEAANDGAL